jgi:hypothetical protein
MSVCHPACASHGFCSSEGQCICAHFYDGASCNISFADQIGPTSYDLMIWMPGALHAVAILVFLFSVWKQCHCSRRMAGCLRACRVSSTDLEWEPRSSLLESSRSAFGLRTPRQACRTLSCGCCCPARRIPIETDCGCSGEGFVCYCVELDVGGCCFGFEREAASFVAALGSALRIVWLTQPSPARAVQGHQDDMVIYGWRIADSVLLRLPQCGWVWAFVLMAIVWSEITAAASSSETSSRFRCLAHLLVFLAVVITVCLTIVATVLVNLNAAVAYGLFDVGNLILAIAVVALAVGGLRSVWRVVSILGADGPGEPAPPKGGCRQSCSSICCPVETEVYDSPETTALKAVREVLRQATLGMVLGVVISVVLISDVIVAAATGITQAENPASYAWYTCIFLTCEGLGSLLLMALTMPRKRPGA